MTSKQSDQDLVKMMQTGDTTAFDTLYERHQKLVVTRLRRIVYDRAAVDDLLQEVFLKLWTHSKQWEGRGTLSAWLQRIAANLALNYLRSARRHPTQPLENQKSDFAGHDDNMEPKWMKDTDIPQPDELIQNIELKQTLSSLIESLPEQQREVIKFIYEMEMDIHETAKQLDVPIGTIKSRLYYARNKLAESLKEWQDS